MINRILVLCVGNICRSPMAEGLLRHALHGCEISSAGLGAPAGQPADPYGVELMQQKGIDISGHRSRRLESWMVSAADLVLVMETEQKRHLEMRYPSCHGKTFRLGEHGKYDIADPYRHGLDAFHESAELIQQGVTAWAARIRVLAGENLPNSMISG